MAIEYMGLNNIQGPLAVIEGVDDTFYEEMVTVTLDNGEKRIGRVIEISGDKAVIQVFEGTSNLSLTNTKTKFMGEPMRLPLSKEMLGRTLDGIGRPIDGLGDYFADEQLYSDRYFVNRLSCHTYKRSKASYILRRRSSA